MRVFQPAEIEPIELSKLSANMSNSNLFNTSLLSLRPKSSKKNGTQLPYRTNSKLP